MFRNTSKNTTNNELDDSHRRAFGGLNATYIIITVLSYLIPVLTVILIFTKIIAIGVVQSGSMEPKLMTGDTVAYNRLIYNNKEPQRGDIVIFRSNYSDMIFGKRIIGIPGDIIAFRNGYVIINGMYCDETEYIPTDVHTYSLRTFRVPENHYFLLGDNRENSNDSRFWINPYVDREDIIGRYIGQIPFSFQFAF